MENEEPTDDLEVEQEDETAEDGQSPEGDESQAAPALTDAQKLAKATADANKWRRLFEKAKGGTGAPAPAPQSQTSSVDVDERILKASGMDDDLLKQLKDIATLRGVSLIDAQKDDLFVAVKTQYEKNLASKGAAMPPSRGSGTPKPKVTLTTPGLTREQHKALIRG